MKFLCFAAHWLMARISLLATQQWNVLSHAKSRNGGGAGGGGGCCFGDILALTVLTWGRQTEGLFILDRGAHWTKKWICTNLLPNYEEQIWYWKFYWSRSTKDPTDPHWFVVVVLPSQVFLKQICSLKICRKYAVKTEELAEVYFFQSCGSPLQLSTDLRIFLQWLKDLCRKKI